jgi:hypothetical protein
VGGADNTAEPETPEARAMRIARERKAEAEAVSSIALPRPCVEYPDWPKAARVWLAKAGIGQTAVEDWGIYWHEGLRRVVIPMPYEYTDSIYWQARDITGRRQKYINPVVAKPHFVPFGNEQSRTLVIVEDLLPAWKVAAACKDVEVWCLLGTRLLKRATAEIKARFDNVIVWLDNDKDKPHNEGQRYARQHIYWLERMGKQVANIRSDRDPKFLWHDVIQQCVSKAVEAIGQRRLNGSIY